MGTLTVQMMDGLSYEVNMEAEYESVSSVKEKLSELSGVHVLEIVLLFNSAVLEDKDTVAAILRSEVPEVMFLREKTCESRLLGWYNHWVEVSKRVQADTDFKDSTSRIQLGACLYFLGEYPTSWTAYKEAASIVRYPAKISDEDLLKDPAVGKYARLVNRCWKRGAYRPDGNHGLKLLKLLAEENRASEFVSRQWTVHLPNNFEAVKKWLLTLCKDRIDRLHDLSPYARSTIGMDSLVVNDSDANRVNFCVCLPANYELAHFTVMATITSCGPGFKVPKGLDATVKVASRCLPAPRVYATRVRGMGLKKRGQHKKNTAPPLGESLEDWDDDWEDWDVDGFEETHC